MGTDIHLFVEFDRSDGRPFSHADAIESIAGGSLLLERSYPLFDALAGGRGSQLDPEHFELPPVVAARGIPSPVGMAAAREFFMLVCRPDDPPSPHFWPHHRTVPPETAEEWLRGGAVTRPIEQTGHFGRTSPQTWHAVEEPGWHNPSWLKPSEFEKALAAHHATGEVLPVCWSLLVGTVSKLVGFTHHQRVRLVLWFDS